MSYPELKMLIAGEWVFGSTGKSEPVICPADGPKSGRYRMPAQQILIAPSTAALMVSITGGQ